MASFCRLKLKSEHPMSMRHLPSPMSGGVWGKMTRTLPREWLRTLPLSSASSGPLGSGTASTSGSVRLMRTVCPGLPVSLSYPVT